MIRACIFDLDGTLCDTVASIGNCMNRVLAEYGLPQVELPLFKVFVGEGAHKLTVRVIEHVQADPKLTEPVYRRYVDRFRKECLEDVVPYEGIVEMLAGIREKGIPIAVLSNKDDENTKWIINTIFGKEMFALVQGRVPEIPRKPDPAGALLEAKQMGVEPHECLYIGDTGTDMQTGNRAGMETVGVLWGFRSREELEENHARHVIGHPQELLELLEG